MVQEKLCFCQTFRRRRCLHLDDVKAVFDDPEEQRTEEQRGNEQQMSPLTLNAFDLIVLSQGLNLGAMFDRGQDSMKYPTRFVCQKPANVLLSTVEVVAQSMGFKTHIRNYKMRVEGPAASKTSYFSVIMEFYKSLYSNLEDIIWKPSIDTSKSRIAKNKNRRRAVLSPNREATMASTLNCLGICLKLIDIIWLFSQSYFLKLASYEYFDS